MVVQKYQATHQEHLNRLTDAIDQDSLITKAVKMYHNSTSGQSNETQRTMATPDWAGETVWNWMKRLNITSISIPDFEAGNTHPGFASYVFSHIFSSLGCP